jgi:hypothetical protein
MSVQPSIKSGMLTANNDNSEVTHFTKENFVKLSTSLFHMWVWVPFFFLMVEIPGKTHSRVSPKLAQLLGYG